MRWIFITLLLLCSPCKAQPSDLACQVVAIHKESRGESLQASRAVLAVIRNRMRIDDMSACEVVKVKGAFPWIKKLSSWKYTNKMLTRYLKVDKIPANVPKTTYYFNDKPVKWGKRYKKIGGLYFNLKG